MSDKELDALLAEMRAEAHVCHLMGRSEAGDLYTAGADALVALRDERTALQATQERVRAAVGTSQAEAHRTYREHSDCIQFTSDCQYERGLINGLTHAVNDVLSALDAPVASTDEAAREQDTDHE